jgi:hypothetical protein
LLDNQNARSAEIQSTLAATEGRIDAHLDRQDAHLRRKFASHEAQVTLRDSATLQRARKTRLLAALDFPERLDRLNQIQNKVGDFNDTFRWIFGHSTSFKSRQSFSAFAQWLTRNENLFWISGKPGSGKSSLMAYIFQNIQPGSEGHSLLSHWAGQQSLKVLAYWFFRPATSQLLKAAHGFWRSICFQLLDSVPDTGDSTWDNAEPSVPASLKASLATDGTHATSWTDDELRQWAVYLLRQSNSRVFLLLDGLDEVEENREELLNDILSLATLSPQTKVCCASRPELPFSLVLQEYPSLRLQDLNKKDVESICSRRLNGTTAEFLIDDITSRANGVLLWASLVAKDLSTAAKIGSKRIELEQLLRDIPDGLSALFRQMLMRQEGFLKRRPKPWLKYVFFKEEHSSKCGLLDLFLMDLEPSAKPDGQP